MLPNLSGGNLRLKISVASFSLEGKVRLDAPYLTVQRFIEETPRLEVGQAPLRDSSACFEFWRVAQFYSLAP